MMSLDSHAVLDERRHGIHLVVTLSGRHGFSASVHPHQSLQKARCLAGDGDGWRSSEVRWVNGTGLDLLRLVLQRRDTLHLFVDGGFCVGHAGGHLRGTGRCLDDGGSDRLQ